MPSEDKKFKIGETKIGEAEVTLFNGEKRTVPVYYGNITNFMADKKLVCINEKRYNSIFNTFINENQDYEVPSEQKHLEDINKVKSLISNKKIETYKADNKPKMKERLSNAHMSEIFGEESDLSITESFDSEKDEPKEVKSKKDKQKETKDVKQEPQKVEEVTPAPKAEVKEQPKVQSKEDKTSKEEKSSEIVISQEMYDKFLEVMKQVENEEKAEKEKAILKNKIAELEKKNKSLDTSLKKEKIQKNKELNEKLDDVLFTANITAGLILTVLIFIYLYLQSLIG